MNLQLSMGLLLIAPLIIGNANAQGQVVVQGATPATSSPAAPNTVSGIKNEVFKETGLSLSTSSPILYLRDGNTSKNFAQSTLVVVPAEGANDLLKLQTNAITTLSNRLKAIEDRLEKLEQKK